MSQGIIGGEAAVVLRSGEYLPEPWGVGGFSHLPLDEVERVMFRDSQSRLFVVMIDRDQYPNIRPIFFRRRVGSLVSGQVGEAVDLAVCIGWQATVNGRNVQSHTYIFEDGNVLVTDRHIREYRRDAFSGSPSSLFDQRIIPILRD